MNLRFTICLFVFAALCGPGTGIHPAAAQASSQASVIKPAAEELRWQQIPWLTDLGAGQKVAQKECRPLFLWVTGDDPLERC